MSQAPFLNRKLIETARRDDCLIVFPHTQRTGGKAFRDQVLGVAYGAERIYSATLGTGAKNWREVTAEDLRGFRVYTGASNYADLDKGRPCVFVGLLRHPLFRAISVYNFCRKRADHRLHQLAATLSLEEFYPEASRVYPVYLQNTQCLRLCGKPDARKARQTIEEKYLGVGFTADLGAFAETLGAALGWPPIQMDRMTPDEERYADRVTPEFRDLVLKESAEDLKLYEAMAAGKRPGTPIFSALRSAFERKSSPVLTAGPVLREDFDDF
jgi:hypothetical protein